jgi:cytoskeletal protein CcmA (bactofilin family)
VSYFSQSKGERKTKSRSEAEPKLDAAAAADKPSPEVVSTLGPGMLITGNIVCTGSVQIFGRVIGDIHVARLNICEGAYVEGKVLAQEAVIDGTFKGTIHSNSVKLQATAVVDGEIYNKSLVIEQNARFEGVSRLLEKAIDAPTAAQAKAGISARGAEVVPISGLIGQNYPTNGSDRSGWNG